MESFFMPCSRILKFNKLFSFGIFVLKNCKKSLFIDINYLNHNINRFYKCILFCGIIIYIENKKLTFIKILLFLPDFNNHDEKFNSRSSI
ncbi:hypothetical protein SAMN02787100_2284 [Chryseobacterium sp. OV279]|nr:hypothetical protein SAMN02787100_2284 [Chryseobacterium sp. OV279]